MGGGAVTGVSRERLNQIAHRKLSSLGIGVQPGPDGQTLQGGLAFSALKHPVNGTPIPGSRFSVVGHDKLRFLDPPLSALPPIDFFDLERAAAIEERVTLAFRVRLGYLRDVAGRLQALKLAPRADPDRLVAVAEVRTVSHVIELLGGPDGVRVGRVGSPGGKSFVVSESYPPLRLEEFQTLTDLELFLSDAVAQMPHADATAPAAAAPPPPARLAAVPAARGALSLSALQRFGPDATVAVSAGGRLEVAQEFELGGARMRFSAVHEGGTLFRAQLAGSRGMRWQDRIDLARFPGTLELVATVLEVDLNPPAPSPGQANQPAGASSHQIAPQPGEVWVMNVLIEREDAAEVRYTCLDVNGQPYGATRLLPRADFQSVFARHGAGWKLLILIDEVRDQTIVYRQLDPGRQARGEQKALHLDHLVSNFVPEACDY